jgi:hypothetical protein
MEIGGGDVSAERNESSHSGNAEPVRFGKGVWLREFAGKACGASGLATGTATFDRRATLPYHRHLVSEAIVVVQGRAQVGVEGRRYLLEPLDCSSRILRVLLSNPQQRWLLRDLAKEAEVSIGLVSKVKDKLIELEFANESRDLGVAKPGDLLDAWARNYSYSDNNIERCYSSLDPIDLEKQLGDAARLRVWRYALTMFSGASKIESFVRYNFASFYYSGSAEEVTSELKLKATPSGANVWIFIPRDEGMYWGTQQAGNLAVVSNVQLYLDLINFKGRGEEQATALREQRLRY